MKTVNVEEEYLAGYETFADVTARLSRFINEVYNAKRMHSALGYQPPEEYETQLAQRSLNSTTAMVQSPRFTPCGLLPEIGD